MRLLGPGVRAGASQALVDLGEGKHQTRAGPGECFAAALRGLGGLAYRKGLELLLDIDTSVPPGLMGDAQRIRQIVTNLVGNALKYTDRGEIRVAVRADSQGLARVELQVEVIDTGIGIAADKQKVIFEVFSQAEAADSRSADGWSSCAHGRGDA